MSISVAELHALTGDQLSMNVAELQALAEETQKNVFRGEIIVASCSFTCGTNSCGKSCVEN
jgi:hypothetical protein